jgi:hypothetical protein
MAMPLRESLPSVPNLPDATKLLLPFWLASLGTAIGLVVQPALVLWIGASSLVARDTTFVVLAAVPIAVGLCARRLVEAGVWVVLACLPGAAFWYLFSDAHDAIAVLAAAYGSPAAAESNLGPPFLVGLAILAIAAYFAALLGLLLVRLRLARSRNLQDALSSSSIEMNHQSELQSASVRRTAPSPAWEGRALVIVIGVGIANELLAILFGTGSHARWDWTFVYLTLGFVVVPTTALFVLASALTRLPRSRRAAARTRSCAALLCSAVIFWSWIYRSQLFAR